MSPELKDIQSRLKRIRADLFRRYPIPRLGLFGSWVRGDAKADSDVDILVEFGAPVGYEMVDLALELERLLERPVDLVSDKAIRPRLRPYIEKDLLYV